MNLLTMGAVDIAQFCEETKEILQFVGYVLTVFKIAIPVLIIAFGMFDFGKAVVAEKEDEIKKQTKRLIYRVVAGAVIFFIPTIVLFIFGSLNGYKNDMATADGWDTCQNCILKPGECR